MRVGTIATILCTPSIMRLRLLACTPPASSTIKSGVQREGVGEELMAVCRLADATTASARDNFTQGLQRVATSTPVQGLSANLGSNDRVVQDPGLDLHPVAIVDREGRALDLGV